MPVLAIATVPGPLARGADIPRTALHTAHNPAPHPAGRAISPTILPESVGGGDKSFSWKIDRGENGAELVTLFHHRHGSQGTGSQETEAEVPLVSVLRDTLADEDDSNDRLLYGWLLTAPHLTRPEKIFSAIPFFFWHIGKKPNHIGSGDLHPQINLSDPKSPTVHGLVAQVVQWSAFDPLDSWVRASSRRYQANAAENRQFYLEQAISYLRQAPASREAASGLTSGELRTLLARLELRKSLLGGLVDNGHAARFADETSWEDERVRSRNWEMLRLCAEKTGLIFEPITLGNTREQYAMLWYGGADMRPVDGIALKPIYRLLNISDPRTDKQVLKDAASGQVRIPLALYSLNYPKLPLMLVDFRDRLQVRRHEMTQRSIADATTGIAGFSRLGNWYFFAAAMAYNVVASRHGSATLQEKRLDCYASFRAQLALDQSLPEDLGPTIRARAESLSVNPMGVDNNRYELYARERYHLLQEQLLSGSTLMERLSRDRRAEQADFGESVRAMALHKVSEVVTFGAYSHRVPKDSLSLNTLDRQRRFKNNLQYLSQTVANGTAPEVTADKARIQKSLDELRTLLPGIEVPALRLQAGRTVKRIESLTQDPAISADCRDTIVAVDRGPTPDRGLSSSAGMLNSAGLLSRSR